MLLLLANNLFVHSLFVIISNSEKVLKISTVYVCIRFTAIFYIIP